MTARAAPSVLLPLGAAALGIATFAAMDGLMKSAGTAIGVYQAMLIRSAFGAVFTMPLWRLRGGIWPARAILKLHIRRAFVSAAMANLFFWGLVRTPMAEAIALSFIAPLIALYLAAAVLGEKIERGAILASLLGLAGVMVIAIARAGSSNPSPEAAWGIAAVLVSAVLYAYNLILQRQQAQLADPLEIAAFQNTIVFLIMASFAPFLAQPIDLATLPLLAGAAAIAVVSLMLLSWGYARAETQVLLPVEYTAFVWAALIGWYWFDEAVTPATLAGTLLIVGGCLLAARRSAASSPPAHVEQTAL